MQFCYVTERDFIRNDCDGANGWKYNFVLYGGTNLTKRTITLYSRYNNKPYSTNLFLNNSVNIANVIVPPELPSIIPHKIYIPGKINTRVYKTYHEFGVFYKTL